MKLHGLLSTLLVELQASAPEMTKHSIANLKRSISKDVFCAERILRVWWSRQVESDRRSWLLNDHNADKLWEWYSNHKSSSSSTRSLGVRDWVSFRVRECGRGGSELS